MADKSDEVEHLQGSGVGPLLSVEEGRKRLEDYISKQPVPTDPTDHTAICREAREMLGDTPEDAECECRKLHDK